MSLDQELLAQIDKYKDVMQKDPNSREFLTLAELYRKLGVAEEATNILREGLNRHPDYVDARLAIARIYLTQGQVEDATREFEEVIRQDPKKFVAYKLLGEIAMQKQDHEKAAERFGSAYKLNPDDPECKVMLDYISSLLGRDITPKIRGGEPAPAPRPPKAAPVTPSPGETIAVSPEEGFEDFEVTEEFEENDGFWNRGS
jgi:cytochrome c-type biogenesis protein CcmH/NrfG